MCVCGFRNRRKSKSLVDEQIKTKRRHYSANETVYILRVCYIYIYSADPSDYRFLGRLLLDVFDLGWFARGAFRLRRVRITTTYRPNAPVVACAFRNDVIRLSIDTASSSTGGPERNAMFAVVCGLVRFHSASVFRDGSGTVVFRNTRRKRATIKDASLRFPFFSPSFSVGGGELGPLNHLLVFRKSCSANGCVYIKRLQNRGVVDNRRPQ